MKKTLVLALAAIMVLGVAGAAFAEDFVATPAKVNPPSNALWKASGTVNVNAVIHEKLMLTVTAPDDATPTDGTLNLSWDITPGGAAPASQPVKVTVSSNKAYTVSRTDSIWATTAGFGVTTSELPAAIQPTGSGHEGDTDNIYTDNVNLMLINGNTSWWDAAAGTYTGTLTYTALQQ